MTFDEWMLTIAPAHKPSDDGVKLRILRACWKASEAAARERCARLCEEMGAMEALDGEDIGSAAMVRVADRMADLCAAAIRGA